MKKKSTFLLLIIMIILTGCSKNSLTTADFKTIAEKKGFMLTDVTNEYKSANFVQEGTVAESVDGWQIEFYILDSEENAINMFNINKDDFEKNKSEAFVSKSSHSSNYSKYSLTSDEYYMYIVRIDNTFLYTKVMIEYKESAKKLIQNLGY